MKLLLLRTMFAVVLVNLLSGCKQSDPDPCAPTSSEGVANEGPLRQVGVLFVDKESGKSMVDIHDLDESGIQVFNGDDELLYDRKEWHLIIDPNKEHPLSGAMAFYPFTTTTSTGENLLTIKLGDIGTFTFTFTIAEKETGNPCRPFYTEVEGLGVEGYPSKTYEQDGVTLKDLIVVEIYPPLTKPQRHFSRIRGLEKADLYTVFLGTNDWWRGLSIGSVADYRNNTGTGTTSGAFRIITDKLQLLDPDANIILITPMQRTDFVQISNPNNGAWGSYKPNKNGQTLEQFADTITAIGREAGFKVVDLYHHPKLKLEKLVKFKWLKDTTTGKYRKFRYPTYTGVPFNPETDEYPYPEVAIDMTYDGLHPSDKGYHVIARELLRTLP